MLTRDEITDEIRAELRRILPHYSRTARGKIEPHLEEGRKLIVELISVEGEKPLDPGRGPWSQIVFDDVKEYEAVARIGWESLLGALPVTRADSPRREVEQVFSGTDGRTRRSGSGLHNAALACSRSDTEPAS